MTIVKCEVCNKEMVRFKSQIKKRIFCSKSCSNVGLSKKLYVQCETCGKYFYKLNSQVKLSEHNYCSKICLYDSQKTGSIVKCEACGVEFWKQNSCKHKDCSIDLKDLYLNYGKEIGLLL